jgi:diguanylate cyclase (GGDEF)-like protein
MAAMAANGLWLLAPSLFSESSIEPESYFLFVLWSVLGLLFFRYVLRRERKDLYGHSLIVWIALLSLILFVSLVWMNQSVMKAAADGISAVQAHSALPGGQHDAAFAARQIDLFRTASAQSMTVVILLFGLAMGTVLNNYAAMRRRAVESEKRLGIVERKYTVDPMTGVKSKHAFADAEEELDRGIAAGTAGPFALAVCDVNGLKHVNDTLGHKAGDEYICAASAMICLVFAHSPVFRTGGDEFVVLLQGADFERRHELMRGLHDLSVSHIASGEVVVSGGLSDFDADADSRMHAVFERADALMYEEKKLLKSLGARTR